MLTVSAPAVFQILGPETADDLFKRLTPVCTRCSVLSYGKPQVVKVFPALNPFMQVRIYRAIDSP